MIAFSNYQKHRMRSNAGFVLSRNRTVEEVTLDAQSRYENIAPRMIFYSYHGGKIADLNREQVYELLANGNQQDFQSFRFLSKLQVEKTNALEHCGFFLSNYQRSQPPLITDVNDAITAMTLSEDIEAGMIFEKYRKEDNEVKDGWCYISDLSRTDLYNLLTSATAAEMQSFHFVAAPDHRERALQNVGFFAEFNRYKQAIVTTVLEHGQRQFPYIGTGYLFGKYSGGDISDMNRNSLKNLLETASTEEKRSFEFQPCRYEGSREDARAEALRNAGFFAVWEARSLRFIVREVTALARTRYDTIDSGMACSTYYGGSVSSLRTPQLWTLLASGTTDQLLSFRFQFTARPRELSPNGSYKPHMLRQHGFFMEQLNGNTEYTVTEIQPPVSASVLGSVLYKVDNIPATNYQTARTLYIHLQSNEGVNATFEFLSWELYGQPRSRSQLTLCTVPQSWDFDRPCAHCGCLYLNSEAPSTRTQCCNSGHFLQPGVMPELFPLPPMLRHYAVNRLSHMTKAASFYNGALSFAATGVDNGTGGGWERIVGDSAAKLHGRTYHFLPNSTSRGGMQYFLYDPAHAALESHIRDSIQSNTVRRMSLETYILQQLMNELQQCNPIARECEFIGSELQNINDGTPDNMVSELIGTLNTLTHDLEIASITCGNGSGQRTIRFKLKRNHQPSNISADHELLEPLTYPLLFPHGDNGWSTDCQISLHKYLRFRLLCPEIDLEDDANTLTILNKNGTHYLPVNRFQIMARLGQIYTVDMVSRSIDRALKWHKDNQDYIFAGQDRQQPGQNARGRRQQQHPDMIREDSSPNFLSHTLHGSRRHLKMLSRNSQAIVSEYGSPTLFITVTCNPAWPEIQEMLLPGQTAFDRPDVVCRVFHARLQALLHNIKAGKYTKGGTIYIMYVIEYQHRGMPHAHIVVKLSDAPDKDDYDAASQWVDANITTQMPSINDHSTPEEIAHRTFVQKHLRHTCSDAVNGCLDRNGHCTKGFHDVTIQPHTTFDARGHPHYKRLAPEDLRVVPHIPNMSSDWGGHCYVTFSGSTRIILYLYKYLFKGAKKVRMQLNNADDIHDEDEINLYLRGRYLCSMDAMWRTLGYQTYPASSPSVSTIRVRSKADVSFFQKDGKLTDMLIYFSRPLDLHHLKYTEFMKLYRYDTASLPTRFTVADLDTNYYILDIPHINADVYLFKRMKPDEHITRMEMLHPEVGEKFYLRLMLLKRPCSSFEDARTVNGVQHRYYQTAAIAAGYVEEAGEAMSCYVESVMFSTPADLRSLFVMLTLEGFPTLRIFASDELRGYMTADYEVSANINQSTTSIRNKLLTDLSRLFRDRGQHTLREFGLPEPTIVETELQEERMRHPVADAQILLRQLQRLTPNNRDQQYIYDRITYAIRNLPTRRFFLIKGIGGCGKSTLAKKIMAFARSIGKVALGCASTGLAATVYDDFYTAHSLFQFPVVDEWDRDDNDGEPIKCNLPPDSPRMELLEAAEVIVWDEFISNHRELFEAAYTALKGFAGKIVICMGDFRQILPVIKRASKEEVLNSCIVRSPHWSLFQVFSLQVNMRLQALKDSIQRERDTLLAQHTDTEPDIQRLQDTYEQQTTFGEMIKALGERSSHDNAEIINYDEENCEYIHRLDRLPYYTSDQQKLGIQFLYPNGFDSVAAEASCILAATNAQVTEWNNKIQALNPNEPHQLLAKDVFSSVDDPHGYLNKALHPSIIDEYEVHTIPFRSLTLKVNDVCLVMRNLSRKYGLATNARVRILHITPYAIRVQTLTDPPKTATIPRIRFKYRIAGGLSFELMRTQFPLRLAYSMTYNKSQSQTLQRVLLDITRAPFAHGHLYVALSRVTNFANISIYCDSDTNIFYNAPIATNVVYDEILHHAHT